MLNSSWQIVCFFLLMPLAALSQPDLSGFKQTDGGIWYDFVERHCLRKKADPGDYYLVHITFSPAGGEPIFSTYEFGNAPEEYLASAPAFNGDISEGLALMHKGDSAIFFVPVDSLYRSIVPEFARAVDYMRYEIRVDNILSAKALRKQKVRQRRETMLSDLAAIRKELDQTLGPGGYTQRDSIIIVPHRKGKGPKVAGDRLVGVHYRGSLFTGEVFEDSWKRGEPIYFFPDSNMVIEGWERAVEAARVGDSFTVYLPSPLAYGNRGAGGVIPPGAVLRFTMVIEHLYDRQKQMAEDWKQIDSLFTTLSSIDSVIVDSLRFAMGILRPGSRGAIQAGDTVVIHYTYKTLAGKVLATSRGSANRPFRLPLTMSGPLEGLQYALLRLQVGAAADIWLPSPMAFGPEGNRAMGIKPFTPIRVSVEVLTKY